MALVDKTQIAQPAPPAPPLPGRYGSLPEKLARAYPDFAEYHRENERLYKITREALATSHQEIALPLARLDSENRTLRQNYTSVTNDLGTLTALIQTIESTYVDEDGVTAIVSSQITAALTGPSGSIFASIDAESVARASADSALAGRASALEASVDTPTTGLLARVFTIESAYVDSTGATAIANSAITAALTGPSGSIYSAVLTESTARATADGFLSGKYTLSVIAGDVVTGMNITSSTGAGTPVSEIKFQADKFQIYNGTLGIAPFVLSGSTLTLNADVVINGTLDVGTAIERTVIDDTTFRRGQPTGNRTEIYANAGSGYTTVRGYNSSNNLVTILGTEAAGGHGQLRLHTAAGVESLGLDGDTGRVRFSETARGGNNSASAPTYSFLDRTNDGLYSSAAGEVSLAMGGRQSYRFSRSSETYAMDVGLGRSGSGAAFIDLIGDTTFTDYGLRIERGASGANADSGLYHRGTGSLKLSCQEAGAWIILGAEQIVMEGNLSFSSGFKTISIDGNQVLATRGSAVADATAGAATDASTTHSMGGSDMIDQSSLESALNDLGSKYNDLATKYNAAVAQLNTLLARLRAGSGHGLIAA
jgi:hypothetical protein